MIQDNNDLYSLDDEDAEHGPQVDAVHRLQDEALDSLLSGDFDDAYGFYDKLSLDDDAADRIDKRSLRRFYMIEQHVDGKSKRQEAASKLFRERWSGLLEQDAATGDVPVTLDGVKQDDDDADKPETGASVPSRLVDTSVDQDDSTDGDASEAIDWKTCPADKLIGKPAHVSYQAFDLDKFGIIAGYVEELSRTGTGEDGIGLIPCHEDGWPQDAYFSIGSIGENGRLKLDSTYTDGMKKQVVRSLKVWETEPAGFHRAMNVTPLPEEEINALDDTSDREYSSFLDVGDDEDDDYDDDELSRVDKMIDSLKNDPEVKAEIERQSNLVMDELEGEEESSNDSYSLMKEEDENATVNTRAIEPASREWKANWIAESDDHDGKPDLSSLEFMAKSMGVRMITMNAGEAVWPALVDSDRKNLPEGMTLVPDWIMGALTGRVMLVMTVDGDHFPTGVDRLIRDGVVMTPWGESITLPSPALLFVVAPVDKIAALRDSIEEGDHED